MPAKNHPTSELTENQYSDLSPDVLRSLTVNVESKLKNQRKGPKTNGSSIKQKGREHLLKVSESTSALRATNNASTPISDRKPTMVLKMSQGKKRLRDGHVKGNSNGTKGKPVNIIRIGTNTRKFLSGNSDKLDEDIRALGGTKEDVDLTADVESGSEMEGEATKLNKNQENGLETEISQLIRQLGVDTLAKRDSLADFESEDADEVGGLQESWSPAKASSNARPIGVKPALLTAAFVGKGLKSLVSK